MENGNSLDWKSSIMEQNKNLKNQNTFGIDVNTKYYAEYNSIDELRTLVSMRKNLLSSVSQACCSSSFCPVLHIGGGSNLLFLKDYNGLVLHNGIRTIEVVEETSDDVILRVGGGMVFDDLIVSALDNGWYGLENLSIIPGEVGASAVQNIGAYGVEAKDFITLVEVVDLNSGELLTMTNRECCYGYRQSIFKKPDVWGRYAVTYVHFRLSKCFTPRLEYGGLQKAIDKNKNDITALELRQIIIDMRNGKLPDPKVLGNAGSFFMNPIISREQFGNLVEQYPSMPHYEVDSENVKVPAGWLIEQSGWKGRSLGKAGVYERQALVLVNLGGATGQDIVVLSDAVRTDVKQKFGIDIHPEVNFI